MLDHKHYKMRVLHLIGSMDPKTGGPCQGIRLSSPSLETMDVHREIVCGDEPTATFLGTDEFPVHALGGKANAWCYSPKLLPWLRDNLHRFDVVVTNGLWLYHAQAVRWVLNERKRANQSTPRWYVMPHGMLDPYFQHAEDRKLKAFRNWLYWKAFERNTIAEADGVLFTCETELLMARETFKPYAPQREVNVGYGVTAPPAQTEAMREAFLATCPAVANKPYLLYLSRIHPKKGVDLLVEAYHQLARRRAAGQCVSGRRTADELPHLVIAGPGAHSPYGKSIKRLIAANPAGEATIHFPGMLSGEAKWGAFYGCEASVLPSHQENFGIAVAESLACGKPVLISNQVNIWREIEAGGGGYVGDNTVAGTLQLLHQWTALSAAEKQAMSQRATDTYQRYFTIEQAAIGFLNGISAPNEPVMDLCV